MLVLTTLQKKIFVLSKMEVYLGVPTLALTVIGSRYRIGKGK